MTCDCLPFQHMYLEDEFDLLLDEYGRAYALDQEDRVSGHGPSLEVAEKRIKDFVRKLIERHEQIIPEVRR